MDLLSGLWMVLLLGVCEFCGGSRSWSYKGSCIYDTFFNTLLLFSISLYNLRSQHQSSWNGIDSFLVLSLRCLCSDENSNVDAYRIS